MATPAGTMPGETYGSNGQIIPPNYYFNDSDIDTRQAASIAMQEALHKGDVAAYQAASQQFQASSGGSLPAWAYNPDGSLRLTADAVASNANNPGGVGGEQALADLESGGYGTPAQDNSVYNYNGNPNYVGSSNYNLGGNGQPQQQQTQPTGGGYSPTVGSGGPTRTSTGGTPETAGTPNYDGPLTGGRPPQANYQGSEGEAGYPSATGNTSANRYANNYYTPPQFNPAGGGMAGDNGQISPIYYGYQIGAAGNPSLSYVPDLTSNDPNRIFRNAQNVGYNYGAGNSAQINQQYLNQQALYNQYGAQADQAYQQLMQQPGYSPDMAQNIIRQNGFNSALTSADQYGSNYLTGDEQNDIRGNTASYGNYFNPQAFNDINQSNANMQYANIDRAQGAQNSALNQLSHAYDTAIDPNRLRASNSYMDQQSNILNATSNRIGNVESTAANRLSGVESGAASQLGNAYSDTMGRLGGIEGTAGNSLNSAASGSAGRLASLQSKLSGQLSGAYGTADSGMQSALGDPGLKTTAEYERQAGMTDEEVDQMANAAARNVGLQSKANQEDIQRRAAAAGNTSPLAIAAARDRANQTGEVASADAVINARLAARDAQRQAATGVQQTQLNANQYVAGQKVGAAQYLGNLGSQNAQYEANLGSQNSQYQSGLESQNAQYLANLGAQNAQYGGNMATSNAQYLANLGAQNAQYQGSLGSQNASYLGNLAQVGSQNMENTRLGAEQSLSGMQISSAGNLAANQIGAAQYQGNLTQNAQNQITQNQMGAQQYITDTGTQIAIAQDAANSGRATQLANNRQATNQYNQQSNYNQNMGVNSALSQGYQTVGNQDLSGQQQYRNYLTGQQSQALGAQQTAQGQQQQNYSTMMGAMNATSGQWANYQLKRPSTPSGWQQLLGGIGNLVGQNGQNGQQ